MKAFFEKLAGEIWDEGECGQIKLNGAYGPTRNYILRADHVKDMGKCTGLRTPDECMLKLILWLCFYADLSRSVRVVEVEALTKKKGHWHCENL